MKRAALGLVGILLVLMAVVAPPAAAHVDLLSSTPEDGAVLDALPSEVSLVFSEDLLPETVKVSVADASGTAVRIAAPTVNGAEVTFPWPGWPPGATGDQWSVNFRVVSQDGHPVSGTVTFTAPPPATATEAAPSSAAPVASAAAPSASATTPATTVETTTDSTTATETPESGSTPTGAIVAIVIGLAVGIGIGVVLVRRGRRRA